MNILLIFSGFIVAFIIVLYYEYNIRLMRRESNKNKVHFYVARDKGGKLWLYLNKPIREDNEFTSDLCKGIAILTSQLDYFGLNNKDYKNLKWENEPIEVFLNMEE